MNNPTAYFEDIFIDNPSQLDLSDGTLLTEDCCSFRIHKIALAKYSKYFVALFSGIGGDKTEYLIPGITGEVLSHILLYIYTEKVHVTETNYCDILVASDYLLVDDLLSQIKNLFEEKLSVFNCLAIHLSLSNINMNDLLGESYRFIQTHFEELVCGMDEDLYILPAETLKQLFDDRNLRVQNENVVWQAIVKWVEADLHDRLPEVPELLVYLRINDVDEKLAAEILQHPMVVKNKFCKTVNFKSQTSYKSVLKFHQYHVWKATYLYPFYIPRKPLCLNFLADYRPWGVHAKSEIYVTYDEKVDLWRKVIEVNFRPDHLVCLDDCIYIFRTYGKKTNLRYNIIQKQWVDFQDMRIKRSGYDVVALGGFLYVLGGRMSTPGTVWTQEIYDVEVYDPERKTWHDATPMLPIGAFTSAVTLNDCIYAVGENTTGNGMAAQMYNPSVGIWLEIAQPSLHSLFSFSLVAYNEKIYIIGGNYPNKFLNVEVFEPDHNVWTTMQSLPYMYLCPRAIVINDQLYVSDDPGENARTDPLDPPVQWNEEQDNWVTVAESSSLFNLRDFFFTFQAGDCMHALSKENKMPTSAFEKSPFSTADNQHV